MRLRVAYEVPRGNPMASYSPHDFRLFGPDALEGRAVGGRVSEGESGNEALLDIIDPLQFSVTVQGFDTRRDVIARVEKVADAAPGNGANE